MAGSHTWAALLRGINVGRAKRVAMADLRSVLESLGYGGVRTLLNSGNAIFTAEGFTAEGFTADGDEAAIAGRIETALVDQLAMKVRVIVRSGAALSAVVAANPFIVEGIDPRKLAVAFLDAEPSAALVEQLEPDSYRPDRCLAGDRCMYLFLPNGFAGSRLPDLGRLLGVTATARNWSTTTKLAGLAGG